MQIEGQRSLQGQGRAKLGDNANIGTCDIAPEIVREIDAEATLLNRTQRENVQMDREEFKNDPAALASDEVCGCWLLRGTFLQRFANQTTYVLIFGLVGCVYSMTSAYFNGTITTMEKRFKIPSKNTGIISVGNNVSQIMVASLLSFYAGKAHRPRWIGFGLLTIVIFCLLSSAPHFIYGPGEHALSLTSQFGGISDENATKEAIEEQRSKTLCRRRGEENTCPVDESHLMPQILLFAAQFISGIGAALYYTLGISYMDDNTEKSKTPFMLSLSFFLNLMGPAVGFSLASYCLSIYIAPQLHPVIDNSDPRWLGAWWMGWLVLASVLFVFGILLTLFPKDLPKRKKVPIPATNTQSKEAALSSNLIVEFEDRSWKSMLKTFKRLSTNRILMYNNVSSLFYFFGYTPYWIFTPKYIEIQYRQSAATSSLATGSVPLAFTAIGILLSGCVISKFKPRARYLAAWNVFVGLMTVLGAMSYIFIGCPGNDQSVVVNTPTQNLTTCNSDCQCDYVPYTPVCGEDNLTYISPCHAGCKKNHFDSSGIQSFQDCTCISKQNSNLSPGGLAKPGACPVDCYVQFTIFLVVMCILKFLGAAGRTSNLIVSVRCVEEKDKTAAMAYGMAMISLLTFIPSPIFFGWLLDRLCLMWGKTCTNKGNCWLYDPASLRYSLNTTAAIFIAIGTLLDCGVWYYVKDLNVYDDVDDDDASTPPDKPIEMFAYNNK